MSILDVEYSKKKVIYCLYCRNHVSVYLTYLVKSLSVFSVTRRTIAEKQDEKSEEYSFG